MQKICWKSMNMFRLWKSLKSCWKTTQNWEEKILFNEEGRLEVEETDGWTEWHIPISPFTFCLQRIIHYKLQMFMKLKTYLFLIFNFQFGNHYKIELNLLLIKDWASSDLWTLLEGWITYCYYCYCTYNWITCHYNKIN